MDTFKGSFLVNISVIAFGQPCPSGDDPINGWEDLGQQCTGIIVKICQNKEYQMRSSDFLKDAQNVGKRPPESEIETIKTR